MKNDILDLGLGKKIQNYRLNKKFTIKELSGLPESNEVRYELLTPDTKGSIEFCLMYIPNNTATEEFNQSHQGEEVAFVLKGTVEVIIEDREYILEEGRKQATLDKNCHFIDDENSKTFF
jgi:mannose-6-phosphate isomerase-like protein (cupin superfamily)